MRTARALLGALALASMLGACSPATLGIDDDLTISARVKTALLNDNVLGALRLDVETFRRVVTLSGTVANEADRDRAIALTHKVAGVADVRSSLKVQP